jgi:hypothetical protein
VGIATSTPATSVASCKCLEPRKRGVLVALFSKQSSYYVLVMWKTGTVMKCLSNCACEKPSFGAVFLYLRVPPGRMKMKVFFPGISGHDLLWLFLMGGAVVLVHHKTVIRLA